MASSHDERAGPEARRRRPTVERNARGAAGWLTSCGMFDNKKKTTMDIREISLPENCKIEKTEDGKEDAE